MFNTRRSQTASGKALLPSGFSSAEPGKPAHLVQLILRAGDVEVNTGPKRVICPVCCKTINDKRETSVWCLLGGWVHLKCTPLKSEKDHCNEFVCSRCSWCKTSPDLTCPTEGHGRGGEHHAARARMRDDRCEASSDLMCPTEGQHGRGGGHRTVRMSSKCRTDERWRKRKEQKRERRKRRQELRNERWEERARTLGYSTVNQVWTWNIQRARVTFARRNRFSEILRVIAASKAEIVMFTELNEEHKGMQWIKAKDLYGVMIHG